MFTYPIVTEEAASPAHYRENGRSERLVAPGAIERYDFDQFPFIARRIEKGGRLRLILSPPPVRCVWDGMHENREQLSHRLGAQACCL